MSLLSSSLSFLISLLWSMVGSACSMRFSVLKSESFGAKHKLFLGRKSLQILFSMEVNAGMKVCEKWELFYGVELFFFFSYLCCLALNLAGTSYIYHNDIFVLQGCALEISKNQKCKCAFLLLSMDLHRYEWICLFQLPEVGTVQPIWHPPLTSSDWGTNWPKFCLVYLTPGI